MRPREHVQDAVGELGRRIRALEDRLLTERLSVYGVAVSRILGAFAYVGILVTNFGHRELLFGNGSGWVQVYRQSSPQRVWLGLLDGASGFVFTAFYLAVIAVGIAFVLGWHARVTGPLLLLGAVQIIELNPLVGDQGDNILRIGLLLILFTDNSAVWSLDALRRREDRPPRWAVAARIRDWIDGPAVGTAKTILHNAAVIAIAGQLVIVYISAGLFKAGGEVWRFGTAIAYPMLLDEYRVWPFLNDFVVSSAVGVWLMTYTAVFLQLYFPPLLLNRVTRRIALAAVILLHVGIAVLMALPWFSLAMVAFDSIFVSRSTYEALGRWATRLRAGALSRVDGRVRRSA